MISTLLAQNPTLVRILFVVAVVASAVLGWLLHRSGRSRALTVLATIGLVGILALTMSPSSGRATAFCTVQFTVPFLGIDTLANVAMMLPLTLFAALRLGRPLLVLAAVSVLSALIELLQAAVPTLGRACDTRGRVRGYRNLYVVDGALIPGATGCTNPSFTIAALAERCMDALVPEVVDERSKVLAAA